MFAAALIFIAVGAQEKGADHRNPLGSPCCRILAQPLPSLPRPMQVSLLLPQSVEKRGDHKLGTPLRETEIYTCIHISLLFVRTVLSYTVSKPHLSPPRVPWKSCWCVPVCPCIGSHRLAASSFSSGKLNTYFHNPARPG